MPAPGHPGVRLGDPRNQLPIAYFRPPDVTLAYVRQRFAQVYRRETEAEVESRALRFMADMAAKSVRPPPPLSEPVEAAPHPWFGLGVHPDIIEALWGLDRALPRPCRWLVWGHPALVHPSTGVIFAVAIGTLGIAARLPLDRREGAPTVRPLGFGRDYDLQAAGPEWRFLAFTANPADACAAYEFAGVPGPG